MNQYIHYGFTCFCRYKFYPVINGHLEDTKPGLDPRNRNKQGGLSGSPFGQNSQFGWIDWWEQHNGRTMRQTYFTFELKSSARVLKVEDYTDLPEVILMTLIWLNTKPISMRWRTRRIPE